MLQSQLKITAVVNDDREVVKGLLLRNQSITKDYLYRKCYPLFRSIFDRYYTDCANCIEFISEIYLFIMTPSSLTGRSKLEGFGFKCTLAMWLKIVAENYCRQLYSKRLEFDEDFDPLSDRKEINDGSLIVNSRNLDMDDLHKILSLMNNQRYRKLIEYRYIEGKTNEETAALLSLSMPNYYNCHKHAKAQYCNALRKEGLL